MAVAQWSLTGTKHEFVMLSRPGQPLDNLLHNQLKQQQARRGTATAAEDERWISTHAPVAVVCEVERAEQVKVLET